MRPVITTEADHCMPTSAELDDDGEGFTARTTTDAALLALVAADLGTLRAHLYDGGRRRRTLSAATIERFGDPDEGWFRVVHRDGGIRSPMRSIDGAPATDEDPG